MRHGSAPSARRAVSALMVGNGLACGVWPAHISAFKQIYGLSKAQLTLLLFTLALGAVLTMRVVGARSISSIAPALPGKARFATPWPFPSCRGPNLFHGGSQEG
jgi:hypothetical protein